MMTASDQGGRGRKSWAEGRSGGKATLREASAQAARLAAPAHALHVL